MAFKWSGLITKRFLFSLSNILYLRNELSYRDRLNTLLLPSPTDQVSSRHYKQKKTKDYRWYPYHLKVISKGNKSRPTIKVPFRSDNPFLRYTIYGNKRKGRSAVFGAFVIFQMTIVQNPAIFKFRAQRIKNYIISANSTGSLNP